MRGVFAKEDIMKGEKILFVPDNLILSLEKGKESPLGKLMTEKKFLPNGMTMHAILNL